MTAAIDFEERRERMVERQIAARGVRSRRALDALRRVRREGHVPSYLGEFAYDGTPLPIEEEQTISQPYIVAFMVVIYRPETELASHYFHALLPHQFDEYVWFDATEAVHPLATHELAGMPETYPFGL